LICNGVFFDNILDFKRVDNSPLTMNDGTAYIDGLLDLNGVIEATHDYAGRIPNSLIPIGDGLGGDLICIGVGENVFGKIYFWDHENELVAKLMVGIDTPTEDIDLYWDNISLVSHTFMDFLNGLEISQDTDDDTNVDAIIVNMKVSDKFLARLKK